MKAIRKIVLVFAVFAAFFATTAWAEEEQPKAAASATEADKVTAPKHSIGIYLITSRPEDISLEKTPLAEFILAPEPLISERDISEYDWETHTIHLKQQAVADGILKRKGLNEPFVVVVDGQRLYCGAMMSMLSSFLPKVPLIYVGPTAGQFQPKSAVRIHPSPIEGAPDPRGDARLRRALEALSLLSRDNAEVGNARAEDDGEQPKAAASATEALLQKFGRLYEPVKVDVKPAIKPYELPLKKEEISNYDDVVKILAAYGIKDLDRVLKDGCALYTWGSPPRRDDFKEAYNSLNDRDLPIYVTSDSLLHLYHIQFDETLKSIEEREFIPDLDKLLQALINDAVEHSRYKDLPPPPVLEARKTCTAYLSVAHFLLTGLPERALIKFSDVRIPKELALIAKHEGFAESPIFGYDEDYSQYVPRGHYTRSEELKRYFKAMMYLGRLTFIIKGGEPHGPLAPDYLVSADEAKKQTIAAAMLVKALQTAKLPDGRRAIDVWQRIYDVTAFYVGTADDLTIHDYAAAIEKALGKDWKPEDLVDEKKFPKVKLELARLRKPGIYSGTGELVTLDPKALAGEPAPEVLDKALAKTQGFRLMGQRFVPDSYVLGKLVFPTVGEPTAERDKLPFTHVMSPAGPIRGFPRGLDVAALLGSKRARQILAETGDDAYKGYDDALADLQKEFAQIDDAYWNLNLYWSWLYCLKPLLAEFGPGYQTYMQQTAWQDKELNAVLGSWSQLRHDTILYAKQSYTMKAGGEMPPPPESPTYVEPVPGFYARLVALSRMTRKALSEMKVLDKQSEGNLKRAEALFERVFEISKKELAGQRLAEEDHSFIRHFGSSLERACIGPDAEAMKTTIIADVHTDQNSQEVLEEATGPLGLVVVVNRLPDGSLALGVGPVFTHYEFRQPMKDRLTDEAWREILKKESGAANKLPGYARGLWGIE